MADSWLVYNRSGEGVNVVPFRDYLQEGGWHIALRTNDGIKYAIANEKKIQIDRFKS